MSRARPTPPRLLGAVCLAVLALGFVAATLPEPPIAPGEELHELMMGYKRQLKELGRGIGDSANDAASLASLAEMQAITLAAKTLEPSNLAEKPKDERAAHTAAYRADMARLMKTLCDMEIAVLEGRNADAAALLQGPLFEQREQGHEKYQPQEEGESGGRGKR